jgi:hypothetical protein
MNEEEKPQRERKRKLFFDEELGELEHERSEKEKGKAKPKKKKKTESKSKKDDLKAYKEKKGLRLTKEEFFEIKSKEKDFNKIFDDYLYKKDPELAQIANQVKEIDPNYAKEVVQLVDKELVTNSNKGDQMVLNDSLEVSPIKENHSQSNVLEDKKEGKLIFKTVTKEEALKIKLEKLGKSNKLIKINSENDILSNVVGEGSQKTYRSYAKKFSTYLIENDKFFDTDEVQILEIITEFLVYYKDTFGVKATSTWRGVINGILYFFNCNNIIVSNEIYTAIKKMETSYQNIQNISNRNNMVITKHAKKILPIDLLQLFDKLPRLNYLQRRNLGVYTLLVIGCARAEMIEKLNYTFIELLGNCQLKVFFF